MEEDAVKFIDSKAVQEMFGYSDTHIDRLVKAGKFPKPMKLTPGSKNLWTEDEMNALAADMLAQRDRDDASPKPRKIKRREVA
jgi:predicted DNA-binding transcriptional regulator AlpA